MSTTVQPDAVSAQAVVEVDTTDHTLTVWPVEFRSAAGRVWTDALEDLAEAEESGDWSYVSPVWGYYGRSRVARGVPDRAGGLCFRFSKGAPVYRELAAMPRLSAAVVVDRARAQIMYVRFRGRRWEVWAWVRQRGPPRGFRPSHTGKGNRRASRARPDHSLAR